MLKRIFEDFVYSINQKIHPNKDMEDYLKKELTKKIDHTRFQEELRLYLDELNLLILEYTKQCEISSFFVFISFETETVYCNFFYEIFTSGKVYILKKEDVDNVMNRQTFSKKPFMILLQAAYKVDEIKELYEKFNRELPIQIMYRYSPKYVIKNNDISSKTYDYENLEFVNQDSDKLDFETYFKNMKNIYKI